MAYLRKIGGREWGIPCHGFSGYMPFFLAFLGIFLGFLGTGAASGPEEEERAFFRHS